MNNKHVSMLEVDRQYSEKIKTEQGKEAKNT